MKDLVDYFNDRDRPLSGSSRGKDYMEIYDNDKYYDNINLNSIIDDPDEDDIDDDMEIVENWENGEDI